MKAFLKENWFVILTSVMFLGNLFMLEYNIDHGHFGSAAGDALLALLWMRMLPNRRDTKQSDVIIVANRKVQ